MTDGPFGSRYEVLRTVSEGRRASVLQALDKEHDRLVALKVYPVTDDDRDELLAEARLLMSIDPHPGLPVVRGDFFTHDRDRYVVVMNWIDGTDLEQVLEEQGDPGLPLGDVIDDLAQVATALDHLHGHQPPIVHGDVKPANVVRAPNGRVVLVDFDIAGAHAGRGRLGTIGYVAPEVAAGEKPDPAADVFGLAATAVTLLNGRPATDAAPTYPGIDPDQQGELARVLRTGLSVDPARRQRSATRLVEKLRDSRRAEQLQGVIAFLATEVADAARLWSDDPEEMQVAMRRLRDVRDEVVGQRGGRVVMAMNEGDTIAAFREASAAALAALDLHDRVAREPFPPGIEVRLHAAIAVGEAALVDGIYTGAVVDKVLRLRSVAQPGFTITSQSTADMLLDRVGRDVSIVPLELGDRPDFPPGASIFGLTRPGAEDAAALRVDTDDRPAHLAPTEPSRPAVTRTSRAPLILDAVQHPTTLVALTLFGFALIFLLVLSPELGMAGPATAAAALGAVAFTGCFAWHYSRGYAAEQKQIADERLQREADARSLAVARERAETRHRLEQGFARVTSDDGDEGGGVLTGLSDEFDAIANLLRRDQDRPSASLSSSLLPDLSEETYRHGMSALSDALELLEFADGPQRRRLEGELAEIEDRLARDTHDDERAKARDEQRQVSHRRLLGRHDEARQRARDLTFEAERCTAALAEARIELASVRAGDRQVDVDAVVETLQASIRRVRDVQDELRRLGY